MTMRAVSLTKLGDASHLIDADVPKPVPAAGAVLIRVKAAAFNPIDFQLRQGGFPTMTLPATLGFDVAGTVESVGAAVRSLAVGDEVYAYLGGPGMAGGYAEYVAAPAAFVAKKPKSLSFLEAASVPLTALTAFQSLRRTRVGQDTSVLVAGGSGGVGSWAIQIARALGVTRVVTTAGSVASRSYIAETLGVPASRIVDYHGLDRAALAAAVRRANDGALFGVALDCVGGAMTNLCVDAVDYEGQVASIVNGPRDNAQDLSVTDENTLFDKSATFHFELVFALAEQPDASRHAVYAAQLSELAALIDAGAVKLPKITDIGTLSADTVRKAHAQLESGHTTGKLVARVGE